LIGLAFLYFFPFTLAETVLAVQNLPPLGVPFQIVIPSQTVHPHSAEYTSPGPRLEIPMRCAACVALSWKHLPLAACPQHVQHPVENLSGLRDRSAGFAPPVHRLRYIPLDFFPKIAADIPPSWFARKRLSILLPSQYSSPLRGEHTRKSRIAFLGTPH